MTTQQLEATKRQIGSMLSSLPPTDKPVFIELVVTIGDQSTRAIVSFEEGKAR